MTIGLFQCYHCVVKAKANFKWLFKAWTPKGVYVASLFDLLTDIVGSTVFAAGIVCFAEKADFAPGGVTGIALIIRHYFPATPIGLCSLALNIPIVLFTYKTLGGWRYFVKALRTSLIFTLIVDLVFPYVPVYEGNPLLAAVFSGALVGLGLAIIYMRGSCTAGIDFVIFAIKKKRPHMSVGSVTLILDGLIILSGWLVFGNIEAVLKGLLMTFVATFVEDKVMYGAGARKLTVIISESGQEIAGGIAEHFERGSTLIKGIGTYSGNNKDILLCACDKNQSATVHRLVHKIDPHALVMQSTLDEVRGEGFKELGLED